MALPRKKVDAIVRGVNLDSEESIEAAVKAILDGASESRSVLSTQLEEAQARIDELQQSIAGKDASIAKLTQDMGSLQTSYDTLKVAAGNAAEVQSAFDAYKAEVESRETASKQDQALRSMFRASGLSREESIDLLMKAVDKDQATFEGDKLTNGDAVLDDMKSKFAFLWPVEHTGGVPPLTPPAGGGKAGMTRKEIAAISDPVARREAIAENPGLFFGEKVSE